MACIGRMEFCAFFEHFSGFEFVRFWTVNSYLLPPVSSYPVAITRGRPQAIGRSEDSTHIGTRPHRRNYET